MNKQTLSILIIGAVLLGAATAYYQPPPRSSAAPPVDESVWQLPAIPEAADPQQLQQNLQARKIWGTETVQPNRRGSGAATQKKTWRFAGVVQEEGEAYMLVETSGTVKRYPNGAELPDGSKILTLREDRAELLSNGEKRTLLLYEE